MLSFANAGDLFTFSEKIWDFDAAPDQRADLSLAALHGKISMKIRSRMMM
jgi:hypothetical protein